MHEARTTCVTFRGPSGILHFVLLLQVLLLVPIPTKAHFHTNKYASLLMRNDHSTVLSLRGGGVDMPTAPAGGQSRDKPRAEKRKRKKHKRKQKNRDETFLECQEGDYRSMKHHDRIIGGAHDHEDIVEVEPKIEDGHDETVSVSIPIPMSSTSTPGNPTSAVKTIRRIKSKKVTFIRHQGYIETSPGDLQLNQTIVHPNEASAGAEMTTDTGQKAASSPSSSTTTQSKISKAASKSKSPKSIKGGKNGESLRRIKREWKDAVKLGIGYDWKTMMTVTVRGRSASGKQHMTSQFSFDDSECHDSDDSTKLKAKAKANDEFYKYNYVRIGPHGSNLLRWHFSVMGPANSCYENGIYHGRILLPKDYPMSPPRVQMLTPSGRFVSGGDICLSASSYHPETWTPRWTILSLVDALRLHMLTSANEIGGVDASTEQRKRFAIQSRFWRVGSIDHGRMLKSGIFCHRDDDNSKDDFIDEDDKIGLGATRQTMMMTNDNYPESSKDGDAVAKRGGTSIARDSMSPKTKQSVAKQHVLVGTALWIVKSPLRLAITMMILYYLWQSLVVVDGNAS